MTEPISRGAEAVDSDDVVDLILGDHREFERLFRALRNREEDRADLVRELADLLVAHAMAEEVEVYPSLRKQAPEEGEEVAHSVKEHAQGHEALAALQAVKDVDSSEWEEGLERLVEVVTHHLDEEEREILNTAREKVPQETRHQLGESFMRARMVWLQTGPGSPEKVGDILRQARRRGSL